MRLNTRILLIMTCTFFGHRRLYQNIHHILRTIITDLIESHRVTEFYVGDEGDFDRAVKGVLNELEKEYPSITYSVVCAKMPDEYTERDEHLLYPGGLEERFQKFAIHYRNLWMLERAQYVVSFVNCSYGGAAKYTEIAKKKGKTVINIPDLTQ